MLTQVGGDGCRTALGPLLSSIIQVNITFIGFCRLLPSRGGGLRSNIKLCISTQNKKDEWGTLFCNIPETYTTVQL